MKPFGKSKPAPAVAAAEEPKPEFRCIVSADLFRRAWFALSTEETRYYLNGVFVEPCPEGGALLTATDGHCLLSFRDPRGVVQGSGIVCINANMRRELKATRSDLFGVRSAFSERVVLVKGGSDHLAYIAMSGLPHKIDGVEVEPRDTLPELFDKADKRVVAAQFTPVVIDGTYPDYRRVIPQQTDQTNPCGAFNQSILSRLAEALSDQSARSRYIKVIPSAGTNSTADPHLVFGNSRGLEGFGVAMPYRFDEKVALPAWAQLPTPAKAA